MNGDGIWLEGANEEDICELPDVSDDELEAAGMDRKTSGRQQSCNSDNVHDVLLLSVRSGRSTQHPPNAITHQFAKA